MRTARPPPRIVKQKEHYGLPVRTYAELGIDSFESIVGAFAKINEIGEGAALQLIVRPRRREQKRRSSMS